jgi:hypothetical protein
MCRLVNTYTHLNGIEYLTAALKVAEPVILPTLAGEHGYSGHATIEQ